MASEPPLPECGAWTWRFPDLSKTRFYYLLGAWIPCSKLIQERRRIMKSVVALGMGLGMLSSQLSQDEDHFVRAGSPRSITLLRCAYAHQAMTQSLGLPSRAVRIVSETLGTELAHLSTDVSMTWAEVVTVRESSLWPALAMCSVTTLSDSLRMTSSRPLHAPFLEAD